MTLTRLTPMLRVADVQRSLALYRDHLGFTLVSSESALRDFRWAHIRRDGVDLMLAGGEGGPVRPPDVTAEDWPVMFYFYPDDVESLHRALGSRGVDVGRLRVTVYRMKEFSRLDPDGHLLTFGQDTNEPPTPDGD